jgi:hypothetical protein
VRRAYRLAVIGCVLQCSISGAGEPARHDLFGDPLADGALARLVDTLERVATPEAAILLQSVAKGAVTARQTREAQQSLERLPQARNGARN